MKIDTSSSMSYRVSFLPVFYCLLLALLWFTQATALAADAEKPATSITQDKLDTLMMRAKTEFSGKNYASAIRYLTALTSDKQHKYYREALELLGLARQRNNQKTQAVTVYERYLKLYPDGDASDRVRQRLSGLLTASSAPRKKIRMSTNKKMDEFTSYGSLAQIYSNNVTKLDNVGNITTQSQLITFFDLTMIQKSDSIEHRFQLTSDHIQDFTENSNNSEFRFMEAYYELSDSITTTSVKLGRQSLRTGGLRRRFDGLAIGYQFTPLIRANLVGGLPVDIDNKSSLNQHKDFYGLIFDIGTLYEYWNFNLYYFDHTNDGIADSNTTGLEAHYRDKGVSLFGLIDYDMFYKEINILQLNTSFLFESGHSLFINAYSRNNPLLTTSNALIGRQESTLEELNQTLSIEQIYQLARDNTGSSQTVTIGISQPVNETFRITSDITLSQYDAITYTPAATTSSSNDVYISAQLVGTSLFREFDTVVIGLRYYDTELYDTVSLALNLRTPITKNWRINPRLQYDIRKLNDGRTQNKIKPSLKTDYTYQKTVRFDFEMGYDSTTESSASQASIPSNFFWSLGYRWSF